VGPQDDSAAPLHRWLAFCFLLAYELRFDFAMDEDFKWQLFRYLPWIVGLKLILLLAFGQFEGLLSYFSLPDLERLFRASGLAFAIVAGALVCFRGRLCPAARSHPERLPDLVPGPGRRPARLSPFARALPGALQSSEQPGSTGWDCGRGRRRRRPGERSVSPSEAWVSFPSVFLTMINISGVRAFTVCRCWARRK
jgi:hypothetical protein